MKVFVTGKEVYSRIIELVVEESLSDDEIMDKADLAATIDAGYLEFEHTLDRSLWQVERCHYEEEKQEIDWNNPSEVAEKFFGDDERCYGYDGDCL